jgi:hypothetical protein
LHRQQPARSHNGINPSLLFGRYFLSRADLHV